MKEGLPQSYQKIISRRTLLCLGAVAVAGAIAAAGATSAEKPKQLPVEPTALPTVDPKKIRNF